MRAAENGHAECARLLIDAGLDPNSTDDVRWVGLSHLRLGASEVLWNRCGLCGYAQEAYLFVFCFANFFCVIFWCFSCVASILRDSVGTFGWGSDEALPYFSVSFYVHFQVFILFLCNCVFLLFRFSFCNAWKEEMFEYELHSEAYYCSALVF